MTLLSNFFPKPNSVYNGLRHEHRYFGSSLFLGTSELVRKQLLAQLSFEHSNLSPLDEKLS